MGTSPLRYTTVRATARRGRGRLVLRSRLGAFRRVLGRHTGRNLAEHFIAVLRELGILHKVRSCWCPVHCGFDIYLQLFSFRLAALLSTMQATAPQ